MKKLFAIALCSVLLYGMNAFADDPDRKRYNFNSDWKVYVGDLEGAENVQFNDAEWKNVTLPHSWNEDDAFRLAINRLPKGIAWYRKTFRLPESAKNQKIFLEFEGLRQAGTVYVNGEEMILHENGVMAFGIDVTDVVRFGDQDNVVAVKTDNSGNYREKETGTGYQWNHSSFYVSYGGLNKNVVLHTVPRVYQTLPLYSNLKTTGVYVYASDIDVDNAFAVINAESEVKNETDATRTLQYSVQVRDMDNKVIAEFDGGRITLNAGATKIYRASNEVNGLNFWSWGYGYLYDVVTVLKEDGKVIDEVSTRTGFRKTDFGEGMVWLNDRVIQMKGYAQRTTNE